MRILIAEDDPSLAEVEAELLTEAGYDVACVSTPAEAHSLVQAAAWDLLLVDSFSRSYRQPEAADISFLRSLAARAPVILVTGRAWATKVRAVDLGIAAIVSKPYDIDQFLQVIGSIADRPARPEGRAAQ